MQAERPSPYPKTAAAPLTPPVPRQSTVEAPAAISSTPTAPARPVVPAPWPLASLLLLALAVFVSVTTELLPTGLLPAMSRDLDVSPGRLGLLVTAYALMVAVLAAPIGMVTARMGRRSLITVALVGYAVCNVVTAVSHDYLLTVGGRLIGGLSHGLFWGMLAGYAGRLVSADRVGRAFTIAAAGGSTAVLLGVPAGTAVGVAMGWRPVFAGFAVFAAALALAGWRWLPRLPGTSRETAVRMRDVIRLPGLSSVVLATGLIMVGQFCVSTYVAPYLGHAGLSEGGLAPVLLASGAAGLVGLGLTGLVVDRVLWGALVAASAALVAIYALLALGGSHLIVAVAGTIATGVAMGMLPVLLQAATLRAAPGAADPASALNASAFNIGIGGGALLGGVTLDHWGAAILPLVATGLTGIGVLAAIRGRRVNALAPGQAAQID